MHVPCGIRMACYKVCDTLRAQTKCSGHMCEQSTVMRRLCDIFRVLHRGPCVAAGSCKVPLIRVGILARLCIIDPFFFLWRHKFQLKLTITRSLGRACIHNGVKIYHAKSLIMFHFLSSKSKYQNVELHVLN